MPKEETKKAEEDYQDEEEREDQADAEEGEGEPEENPEDGDAEEDEEDAPVYIEKDFVARPYESESKQLNIEEVESLKPKNTRKPYKVRISRRRCEFNSDAFNFIEREPGDGAQEIKAKKINSLIQNKMVLDIALQAAKPMKTFSSQTYHNRSVNLNVEYNPKDFLNAMPDIDKNNAEEMLRMEKFFDKVAPRIEEALQSNELINVFQDDFEMLGDKKKHRAANIANQQSEPLPFSDIDHGKNKSVS